MIIAKPVIKDKFWILKQDDHKVGNIEAVGDEYSIKINDTITRVKNISTIRHNPDFAFDPPPTIKKISAVDQVHGYSTGTRAYNSMWDVKKKIPLFTKTKKSKSWYAAGWYRIKQGRSWDTVFCPKLITLQRYPYSGPCYTEGNANEHK